MTTFVATRLSRHRGRIALTVLCSLLSLLFLVAAGMKLGGSEFETHNFAHFGYAPWFMTLIGVLELAGAVGLLLDRSRAVAALGMTVLMVGAVASHLGAGDGMGMATPAAITLALCLLVAYVRRRDLTTLARR